MAISGRHLARSFVLNLGGEAIPALLSLAVIPLLITRLGVDRFGVLTLAWSLIGYFSLFDLGLGRALTAFVAERLATTRSGEIRIIVRKALVLILAVGIIGSSALLTPARWLVTDVLNIPAPLRSETLVTFWLIAIGIPVVATMAGLRGVLEAQQRFAFLNAVRIPMGVLQFLAPLLVSFVSLSLVWMTASLLLVRVVAWIIMFYAMRKSLPPASSDARAPLSAILRYGGWLTVSQVVGPLMVTLDRFVVAAVVSAAAVAYYATPNDMVSKFGMISNAIAAVAFPAFAASFRANSAAAAELFNRSLRWLMIALFPASLVVVVWAHEGLRLWLGAEFAERASVVLQILTIGVFINGFAKIPFSLVQAASRPDLTARSHVTQLPFFLVAVYVGSLHFGIVGAAAAFTARMAIDTTLLFLFSNRLFATVDAKARNLTGAIVLATVVLVVGMMLETVASRALFSGIALVLFSCLAWSTLISAPERIRLIQLAGMRRA